MPMLSTALYDTVRLGTLAIRALSRVSRGVVRELEPDFKRSGESGEPSQGEADGCDGDEGGEGVGEVLVILGEAPVAAEPGVSIGGQYWL